MSKNGKRILHVLDHSIPLHSGYAFRTQAIIEHQREMGWETFQITSSKQINCMVTEETVGNIHFFRTLKSNSLASSIPILNQLVVISSLEKRLREIVSTIKPDVIHAHSPALNGIAAIRVGRSQGIPVVYECRAYWEDAAVNHGTSREWGLRYRLTRAMETWVFRRANAITTICEGLRNEIISRGINPESVTVIPNAVDASRFGTTHPKSDELRIELGLNRRLVLGFIGSFYGYEGLELLLDSMSAIIENNSDIRLLLVGGGPEDAALRAKVAELGLSDVVIFTGRVPHDEVNAYYDLIDLCVYPRLKIRLTELVTPLKPLEAMAHRRLVVASNIGGHRELIQSDVTGVLFEPENKYSLAELILRMVSTRKNWAEFHSAGRSYVERERTWSRSVSFYKRVYSSVLNHR